MLYAGGVKRVRIGPRVSRWWWLWGIALVVLMVGNVNDGQWASAVLWPSIFCAGASEYAQSLRQRNLLVVVGSVLGIVSAALGFALHDWLALALGAMLALAFLAFLPKMNRDVPTSRFPTEELVGRTVSEATHLIGYDRSRQPGELQPPVLVPLPIAELDLTDPVLTVTAVAVDADAKSVTFGVAAPGTELAAGERESLQRQLVAQVGGGPADIRPLRFPTGGYAPPNSK